MMPFSKKSNARLFGTGALLILLAGFNGCIKEDDGVADTSGLPVLEIVDVAAAEGDVDQTLSLSVALSGENRTNVVVSFAGVAGSALSGSDYEVLTSGRLVFAPGETTKTIDVRIIADEAKEPRETFQIKLYNPINARFGGDVATISIDDDDDNTAGLVIPASGYSTPETYLDYNLVWADEFNGTELDLSSWTYELGDGCPGNCNWGNNELQYYREENTALVDGYLVITAKEQPFASYDYTSSRLITKGKRQFKFGRIDIRAALPKGQGLWPAFWMLGSNIDAVGWPACGEIDIMEMTGNLPNRVLSTVHYRSSAGQHQYTSMSKYLTGDDNFHDEFHVFSMIWEEDKIEFFIDDELYHTITPASLNGAPYPFNKNFFFIFNVAVGGNLPGNPNSSTAFPQNMIVDYVRVFQK